MPNPPSPIKLTTVLLGFATLIPKPQANEKPTNPKSKGVKREGGL
jgi:hypothetical protein